MDLTRAGTRAERAEQQTGQLERALSVPVRGNRPATPPDGVALGRARRDPAGGAGLAEGL